MTVAAAAEPPATTECTDDSSGNDRLWRPGIVMALAYVVVSAPVVGELIRVWRSSWYPSGDDAALAIVAHSVFSRHTPLVGPYSSITDAGPAVFHLGPLVFWALAIPERLFSQRMGIEIAAAIVEVVAAMALVRSVRRTYGSTPALASAGIVALTCWSLGRNTLAEAWNPFIGLIPLMLVLVYALELASGSLHPLPWFALAASFVVQSHYVYTAVVLVSAVVGIALGINARRRARRPAIAEGDLPPPEPGGRRAVVAAVIVTLACWLLPLIDEVVHRPGNLTNWVRSVRHAQGYQLALSTAWRVVVHAIGWVPLAARGPLTGQVLFGVQLDATWLAQIVAWIVVASLFAVTVSSWRGDARIARFTAFAAILIPTTLVTVWRIPLTYPVIPSYRIVMLWPIGAFVCTAAIVGVGAAVSRRVAVPAAFAARHAKRGVAVVAALAMVASVVAVAGAESMGPADNSDSLATRAIVAQTLERLPQRARYLVRSKGGSFAVAVQYGLIRVLLDHGYHVFVDRADAALGREFASDDPRDSVVLVSSSPAAMPPRARQIAVYDQSTRVERAQLERTRVAASAALRAEPLRLTARGDQQRRQATGLRRIALDAVVDGTITPDLLSEAGLDNDVLYSSASRSPTLDLFVVGPRIVPALTAYASANGNISGVVVRVAVLPSGS